MNNKLIECPFPKAHEENRECVYCDKATKYNIDKLMEKRNEPLPPPTFIPITEEQYNNIVLGAIESQQQLGLTSIASRMATAEELLQADLVTINQANQLIQEQFNANRANQVISTPCIFERIGNWLIGLFP